MALLKDGIIAYPAPLQLQCLLYLVGHLDELTSTSISLLPRHIRHELLLLLPAVDVCQLEGTPVTADILMDDVWQTLYNNRIDGDYFDYEYLLQLADYVSLSWKDKYFNEFLMQMSSYRFSTDCKCFNKHFHSDMLYAFYKFKNDPFTKAKRSRNFTGYQCFSSHTQSVQGLTRYTDQCVHLIPMRYKNKFYGKFHFSIDLLKNLVDTCQLSFKIFDSNRYMWCHNIDIDSLLPYLVKLFSTVEAVICPYENENIPEHMADIIFRMNPICHVRTAVIQSHPSSLLFECLASPSCSLKQISIIHDNESSFDDKNYFLNEIIEKHQSLERLHMHIYASFTTVPTFIMMLFERPSFKELYLHKCYISFQCLYDILELFLMSPCPVSLTLNNCISHARPSVLPTEIIPNATQHSKSITITDCDIPSELLSIIPEEFLSY